MEILFGLFEAIIATSIELMLQMIGQMLIELGFYSLGAVFQKKPGKKPWLAGVGYFIIGSIVGGVSLLIFPYTFLNSMALKIANLFITPAIAGCLMSLVGNWRERRGQERIRLDNFSYGFIFAFGMALVRFLFTGHII